ncbi:hypothetical protein MKK63_23700 [Methylobacterium sp. J-088]|uniref:hypothetical protein n=1 Tax=Methylobacterium sp. J-088 TaxID=2836664 RepID=UPI001FB86D66|nr:hypothetical protein [Methylobacterium sp. J-088]MCJ2065691.1 hypothetical protein [Methylobacterium sp. J-088]
MFISANVPNISKVRLDTHPAARHLERMPAQHGQTYDPKEEPTPRTGFCAHWPI